MAARFRNRPSGVGLAFVYSHLTGTDDPFSLEHVDGRFLSPDFKKILAKAWLKNPGAAVLADPDHRRSFTSCMAEEPFGMGACAIAAATFFKGPSIYFLMKAASHIPAAGDQEKKGLLLKPDPAIACLQKFLIQTSRQERGELLLELGQVFALQSRYDFAETCHRQARDLLAGTSLELDNLFGWAVTLSYLQRIDQARELLHSILAMDVNHEGAATLLRKLEFPEGMLQVQQLLELSFPHWSGLVSQIRGER